MSKFNKDMETHLLELLNKELKLFEKMKEHIKKQTELLASDMIEEFNKDLESAEKLKEKINGLHQESDVLMQSYITSVKSGERGKIKEIDDQRDKIRDIITECRDINEEIQKTAGDKMTEYTKRIKELDTSRKTFGAYALALPDNSVYFDKTT